MEIFQADVFWKHCISIKVRNYYIQEQSVRKSSRQCLLYRKLQPLFSANPLWDYAIRNPNMLHACFSIAQIIAYTACTDFSHCSRCGNSDIDTRMTEHILINCLYVRSLSRIPFNKLHLSNLEVVFSIC